MHVFSEWESLYVIVGSCAGALIGVQFVVITLVAESPISRDIEGASNAFATPTIVHFRAVLLLSAIRSAPWQRTGPAAVLWGVLGLFGVTYVLIESLIRDTAHPFGHFSARAIRCVAWIQTRMIHGMQMFCGALWRSVPLPVFLQRNLGRIFGGTTVNSTCVFDVSAKEVSHDT